MSDACGHFTYGCELGRLKQLCLHPSFAGNIINVHSHAVEIVIFVVERVGRYIINVFVIVWVDS